MGNGKIEMPFVSIKGMDGRVNTEFVNSISEIWLVWKILNKFGISIDITRIDQLITVCNLDLKETEKMSLEEVNELLASCN